MAELATMSKKQVREWLKRIYKQVPEFKCQKEGCYQCCGPIVMLQQEHALIKLYLRKKISRKELAERKVIREPDTKGNIVELTCPLVDKNGKCLAYPVRPLMCRMMGSYTSMSGDADMACPEDPEKAVIPVPEFFKTYSEGARFFDLRNLLR